MVTLPIFTDLVLLRSISATLIFFEFVQDEEAIKIRRCDVQRFPST